MNCNDRKIAESLDSAVLCWLATTDGAGMPNVSPKEIFAASEDGHLLIANIASPKSVANIEICPNVCVSLIDVFEQKGIKLIGLATIISQSHTGFSRQVIPLRKRAGDAFPIKDIIKIEVQKAEIIIAPSYKYCPDISDAERRKGAYATYGVKPAGETPQ